MKTFILLSLYFVSVPLAQAVCSDGKTYPIHFTFDDGPHSVLTPKVLDILKKEEVPATFFVMGKHFSGGKKNPSNKNSYRLLDRMKAEGHRIGSHTYEHINHPQFAESTIKENIIKSNSLLKDYLSPVLRLPYGAGYFRSSNPTIQAKNDMIMRIIEESGMKHVAWDIDTNDWDVRRRPNLLSTLLKDICRYKGGVVLFHDVQKFTVDNVEEWIKVIKKEGHPFVTLEHFVHEASETFPSEDW